MSSIIFKISLIVLMVGFLAFLAYDDHRNRKAREAEDREKEGLRDSDGSLPGPGRGKDEERRNRPLE